MLRASALTTSAFTCAQRVDQHIALRSKLLINAYCSSVFADNALIIEMHVSRHRQTCCSMRCLAHLVFVNALINALINALTHESTDTMFCTLGAANTQIHVLLYKIGSRCCCCMRNETEARVAKRATQKEAQRSQGRCTAHHSEPCRARQHEPHKGPPPEPVTAKLHPTLPSLSTHPGHGLTRHSRRKPLDDAPLACSSWRAATRSATRADRAVSERRAA